MDRQPPVILLIALMLAHIAHWMPAVAFAGVADASAAESHAVHGSHGAHTCCDDEAKQNASAPCHCGQGCANPFCHCPAGVTVAPVVQWSSFPRLGRSARFAPAQAAIPPTTDPRLERPPRACG